MADELSETLMDSTTKGVIFPVGETYHGFYEQLVSRKDVFMPLLKHIHHSNLDELYPLPPKDPNVYITYMRDRLIRPLKLEESQWIIPSSSAEDPKEEVERFQQLLGIRKWAVALLGIGPDAQDGIPLSLPISVLSLRVHLRIVG